jgi:hypothetical protein
MRVDPRWSTERVERELTERYMNEKATQARMVVRDPGGRVMQFAVQKNWIYKLKDTVPEQPKQTARRRSPSGGTLQLRREEEALALL